MEPNSLITNPGEFLEFPIVLMERVFAFTVSIMQQAFEFATTIFRLAV